MSFGIEITNLAKSNLIAEVYKKLESTLWKMKADRGSLFLCFMVRFLYFGFWLGEISLLY